MFDMDDQTAPYYDADIARFDPRRDRSASGRLFRFAKRSFDIVVSLVLLSVMCSMAVVLLILNPFVNPGPLFYRQDRMGQGCEPFKAIKFRSMLPAKMIVRGPYDSLETSRITALGRVLRKTRLDEVPQVINVLKGQISLIGPRPDYYDHACEYLQSIPGYRERHMVKPGISGYAQIEVGYADGKESVRRKVEADLHYIRNASFRFDTWILWRTLVVVSTGKGT